MGLSGKPGRPLENNQKTGLKAVMMRKIKCEDVKNIKNRRLREEIEYYMGVYEMFRNDTADYGIEISEHDGGSDNTDNLKSRLSALGVKTRNDCKSYVWGNTLPLVSAL